MERLHHFETVYHNWNQVCCFKKFVNFAIRPVQMSHANMWTLLSMFVIHFVLLRCLRGLFLKDKLEFAFDFVKLNNCLHLSQNNRRKQSLFYKWQLWKRKKTFYFLKWKFNQICPQFFPIKFWKPLKFWSWLTSNSSHSVAVVQKCSVKKVFLEISQKSQENTCASVSF